MCMHAEVALLVVGDNMFEAKKSVVNKKCWLALNISLCCYCNVLQLQQSVKGTQLTGVSITCFGMISGCVKMQQNLNVQEDEKSRCKVIKMLLNHMEQLQLVKT